MLLRKKNTLAGGRRTDVDMTEGNITRHIIVFAIPLLLGNIFQQLYNMVDTAVVGKFVGEDAVAAVGSSFPVVFLAVAIASGLSIGCNVVISQLFGAKRIHEMKTTVTTAIISMGTVGLALMLLGLSCAALAEGKPVYLYTPGLPEAPKNRALSGSLTAAQRELKNWGVVFTDGGRKRLVTAQEARLLRSQGRSPAPGAVLTPLAREIFEQ